MCPRRRASTIEHDGIHFSDQDTATYCRPEVGNHILIGSEDPECDKKEWVDPDDFSRELTEQGRIQAMRVAQRFTGLPIPSRVRGVVELYDVSDNSIPIYDKSDLPGFYMAVGTSGNQFKNAPVVGEMMAALIDACEAGRDQAIWSTFGRRYVLLDKAARLVDSGGLHGSFSASLRNRLDVASQGPVHLRNPGTVEIAQSRHLTRIIDPARHPWERQDLKLGVDRRIKPKGAVASAGIHGRPRDDARGVNRVRIDRQARTRGPRNLLHPVSFGR